MFENEIKAALKTAIHEYNASLKESTKPLADDLDTPLVGEGAVLDSFGLVTLILAFEQAIEDETELLVELADDRALQQTRSPYRTLGSLQEYAISLSQGPN